MKLRLSARAQADLDGIAVYLEPRDPQAAQQVQDDLSAALRMLLDHPQGAVTWARVCGAWPCRACPI